MLKRALTGVPEKFAQAITEVLERNNLVDEATPATFNERVLRAVKLFKLRPAFVRYIVKQRIAIITQFVKSFPKESDEAQSVMNKAPSHIQYILREKEWLAFHKILQFIGHPDVNVMTDLVKGCPPEF